jgi:hypothetical protein
MGAEGVYRYPNDYKKDITIVILDVTRFIQVYKITYKKCWPTNAEPYALASSSSDRLIASQEFAVDDIEMTCRNIDSSGLANTVYKSLSNFPGQFFENLSGVGGDIAGKIQGSFTSYGAGDNPSV